MTSGDSAGRGYGGPILLWNVAMEFAATLSAGGSIEVTTVRRSSTDVVDT